MDDDFKKYRKPHYVRRTNSVGKQDNRKIMKIPSKGVGRPKLNEKSPLTRRQEKFVKELISNDGKITMRQAAINAGYSEDSATQQAYLLTNNKDAPHVVAAIRDYRSELDAKYAINYRRHIRDLQDIRDKALDAGAYSAAVQAEYRRGMAHGDIYINKTEIRSGTIDSMTREEVMKALNDMGENATLINGQAEEIDTSFKKTKGSQSKYRERVWGKQPDVIDKED